MKSSANVNTARNALALRWREDSILQLLKLLLKSFHLLPVHLHLFAYVAQNKSDIARHSAKAKNFAAAIERACRPRYTLTARAIIVTDFDRESRIDDEAMGLAHLNLCIDRHRRRFCEIDDDIAVGRLQITICGILRRRHKPRRDASRCSGGFDIAVGLREVDAAIRSVQIRRTGAAGHANTTTIRLCSNKTRRLANLDLSASGLSDQFATRVFERDIPAVGFYARCTGYGIRANVSTMGVEKGVAADGTRCDMSAARLGKEFACYILDGDMSTGDSREVRTSIDVAGRNVSALRQERLATGKVIGSDVADTGGNIEGIAFRNRQINGDPQAPRGQA